MRVAPTFGNPNVSGTQVSNTWGINGDTPDYLRIYTNPFNTSITLNVDVTVNAHVWSGLPPGTLMAFSVGCVYENPYDLLAAAFYARTTGSPPPPPPPPPGADVDSVFALAD